MSVEAKSMLIIFRFVRVEIGKRLYEIHENSRSRFDTYHYILVILPFGMDVSQVLQANIILVTNLRQCNNARCRRVTLSFVVLSYNKNLITLSKQTSGFQNGTLDQFFHSSLRRPIPWCGDRIITEFNPM